MKLNDRNYLRTVPTLALLDAAKHDSELSLVLAERLSILPDMGAEMVRLEDNYLREITLLKEQLVHWQRRAADATLRAVNTDAALQAALHAARDPGDD